jgi:hypothetical protein
MTTPLEKVRAAYEQHRQGDSNPLRRTIAAGDEKPAPPWEKLPLAVREAGRRAKADAAYRQRPCSPRL